MAAEDVDPDEVSELDIAGKEGYRAFLTAPLRSHRGTYGVLALFYDTPRSFVDDEKVVLRTFAIQAAIALDNRRLMREKDQMAVRDGLTGAYNRSYLELTLERVGKELRRNGGVVSILFVDLDGLKKVNDNHGHRAGDELLRQLATLLMESCRATDIVARYGGDEFVVLMPGTDAEGAGHVVLKVQDAIARYNAAGSGTAAAVGEYRCAHRRLRRGRRPPERGRPPHVRDKAAPRARLATGCAGRLGWFQRVRSHLHRRESQAWASSASGRRIASAAACCAAGGTERSSFTSQGRAGGP